ncbi:unnamed protein product [Brugia pahangi]|uniref:Ovule protein n=1 Tax=Brugia pahangi TaxID=6280 RepID=A0A0N4TN87_BRUPA|nr:unnamed protein product [Brugia pahangi]
MDVQKRLVPEHRLVSSDPSVYVSVICLYVYVYVYVVYVCMYVMSTNLPSFPCHRQQLHMVRSASRNAPNVSF